MFLLIGFRICRFRDSFIASISLRLRTGISDSGLSEKIENISLKTWLYGTAAELPMSIPEKYKTLMLCQKIKNLNKYFINEIVKG